MEKEHADAEKAAFTEARKAAEARVGLSCIVASHYSSITSYQIHEENRYFDF